MIDSDVLQYEISNTSDETRRNFVRIVLNDAVLTVTANEELSAVARTYQAYGRQPIDALHLAAAGKANVEYFCTADDELLKKAKHIDALKFKIVTPREIGKELQL